MDRPLTIRAARPEEAERLSALAMRSKAVWGYTAQFMEVCRYLVAEQQGEILRFCGLEFLSPDSCELAAMFVEPAHIGSGVGKALIIRVKTRAAAAGVRTLINHGDPNAVDFYRAAGGEPAEPASPAASRGDFCPCSGFPSTTKPLHNNRSARVTIRSRFPLNLPKVHVNARASSQLRILRQGPATGFH